MAGMPGWFPLILDQAELDLSEGPGYSFEPTSVLLERFDAGGALKATTIVDARRRRTSAAGPTALLTGTDRARE